MAEQNGSYTYSYMLLALALFCYVGIGASIVTDGRYRDALWFVFLIGAFWCSREIKKLLVKD